MIDNEIILFKHEKFGEICVLSIDGEPWFWGKEIAEILGYGNGNNNSKAIAHAIADHVDEEDKRHISYDEFRRYRNGHLKNISHYGMVIINENGLYSLILSSKLPGAKKFRRWVTAEVLPSLRKHGAYFTAETLCKIMNDPREMARLLNTLADEQDKHRKLE